MKREALPIGVLVAIGVALAAAGCGSPKTVTRTVTVGATQKTGFGPPSELVEFGYIKTLKRKGSGYVMRFDPAWLLSGVTANTAAAQDGVVEPGQPVPNDNYTLDEGHRLLTYKVAANAHVTALTKDVTGTPITVSQLAQLVGGKN